MSHHSPSSHRPCIKLPAAISILIFFALLCFTANTLAAEKVKPADHEIKKILFLGNSITKHGDAPRIGWHGVRGMAASTLEKDYVHVAAAAITKKQGTAPEIMVETIAAFERDFTNYDVAKNLKEALKFKPDTLVLAIAENVPPLKTEQSQAQFKASVLKLLSTFKADSNPAIIVRSGFWPDKTKDEILRQVCKQVGGTFVDISDLAKDESNYARSERDYKHAGVAAHPGDKGMKAIADAILKAIK
ncbi:MAG: SGNH/GDSL hydrolase family protein [Pirellulales bacterium]|nr:SGNH/GDSL hydrolase family protein [Pirellulales bacterium]